MVKKGHKRMSFFRATAVWTAGLTLVAVLYPFLVTPPGEWLSHAADVGVMLIGQAGLTLPFAAFAGGLASAKRLRAPAVLARAVAVALLSYGLLGYAKPVLNYHTYSRGAEMREEIFPFGPLTPRAELLRRRAILASPPDEYHFRADEPFRTPPNWIIHNVHLPMALALYALPAALLGLFVGVLSSGLSPRLRRTARWALGLASSMAFFIPMAVAGNWIMGDPKRPGVLAAWAPMVIPLAEVLLLLLLLKAKKRNLPVRALPDVQ